MYNYNPYNQFAQPYNPYNQNNIQQMEQIRDQWDAKIQLAQQQQQNQIQQQQPMSQGQVPITQNFQLAPQTNNTSELESRYAENIDEVKNTFVMKTAIFAKKDYSIIWVKDVSGNIKTFKTEEVIERDEKDIQIQNLQRELAEMKNLMAQAMKPVQEPIQTEIEMETKPKKSK